MNGTKASGRAGGVVHILSDDKPLCGSVRKESGIQETMFLKPNCKKCLKIGAKNGMNQEWYANSR
jgi:hypothetical protein